MRSDLLAELNIERAARRAAILITEIETGEQRLVCAADIPADPFAAILEEHLRFGKSAMIELSGKSCFLLVVVPPVRLILIGAVHISQVLVPMAKLSDFDLLIIDPRTAFASPERFPNVALMAEWPQDVLPSLGLDRYTGLALLTHDPKIDDPALVAGLAAECFYIGALGSKKTHAKRLDRMRAAGFQDSALTRIHAPIGLDIGAITPAEIAVSILGEIIAALRKSSRYA